MTERVQRLLWTVLALIAIALSAATVYLYSRSRGPSTATEKPAGRIAYVSFSETTGIPQLYTCDALGGDVRPLVQSRFGDLLPVCAPQQGTPDAPVRIAFVRFRSDPGDDAGTQLGAPGGVYVVRSDGGQERMLSEAVERPLQVAPAWSPDGGQLAFAGVDDLNNDGAYPSEEAGIYVADVETGQSRRVAAVHATGTGLHWSPVSAQLILQVHRPGASSPVAALLDLQTGELSFRDDTTTVGCWSPDGQAIAAYSMGDSKIHVLNSEGAELLALDGPPGYVTDLYWLPAASTSTESDGRFLAVASPDPNVGWGQLFQSSDLIAHSVTIMWRQLTPDDLGVAFATPSADGRWATFTGMPRQATGLEADVYLVDLATGQSQQLTQDAGFEGMATWVPERAR
jgi:Tol biopolymer transport system component